MRKLIYSLGIASFLAMMIFTVATSLTNPFYGMSEVALAQAMAAKGTDYPLTIGTCLPTGCKVTGYIDSGSGDVSEWWWQYTGCNSFYRPDGNNCCYILNYGGCE